VRCGFARPLFTEALERRRVEDEDEVGVFGLERFRSW
jgi:hypothetical protein